ncbi:hypothetical protein BO82DRAFT_63416 [Aspergillus uvarum CBS 121591]|uniref:Uncharacterized protein n=1 Tax=Aspergillus uvarum CBS 121591 TaxID=1448315 RepID=A0A319DTP7_9EURO|nr:hypothetical protein BO82DRAFT_63416 [Aspergillus uvarum CBS 121591]PYH82532.1 hypothetical protein BO82DRAFT_63416 [Aspergillus uvarum CBS 121591]
MYTLMITHGMNTRLEAAASICVCNFYFFFFYLNSLLFYCELLLPVAISPVVLWIYNEHTDNSNPKVSTSKSWTWNHSSQPERGRNINSIKIKKRKVVPSHIRTHPDPCPEANFSPAVSSNYMVYVADVWYLLKFSPCPGATATFWPPIRFASHLLDHCLQSG